MYIERRHGSAWQAVPTHADEGTNRHWLERGCSGREHLSYFVRFREAENRERLGGGVMQTQ